MLDLIAEIILALLDAFTWGAWKKRDDRSIVGDSPMDLQARWFWGAVAVVLAVTVIAFLVCFR